MKPETISYIALGIGAFALINYFTKGKIIEATGFGLGSGVAGATTGIWKGYSDTITKADYIPVIDEVAGGLKSIWDKAYENYQDTKLKDMEWERKTSQFWSSLKFW
jgi:hypothetical protein